MLVDVVVCGYFQKAPCLDAFVHRPTFVSLRRRWKHRPWGRTRAFSRPPIDPAHADSLQLNKDGMKHFEDFGDMKLNDVGVVSIAARQLVCCRWIINRIRQNPFYSFLLPKNIEGLRFNPCFRVALRCLFPMCTELRCSRRPVARSNRLQNHFSPRTCFTHNKPINECGTRLLGMFEE